MMKAQRHPDERAMVLLLTDGLPQAVQGDSSPSTSCPLHRKASHSRRTGTPMGRALSSRWWL